MIDALLALPSHLCKRLENALHAGLLVPPCQAAAVRAEVGNVAEVEGVVQALRELDASGVSGPGCAALLRCVDRAVSRRPTTDFVWSGPEVPGLHARDTRRVYEELLGSATRSAWVATYAFFDGPRAFEVLARRMDETPALKVTLLLNVQRKEGRYDQRRSPGQPVRGPLLEGGVAGNRPAARLLRPAVRQSERSGRPAREGRCRRRRGGVRDVSQSGPCQREQIDIGSAPGAGAPVPRRARTAAARARRTSEGPARRRPPVRSLTGWRPPVHQAGYYRCLQPLTRLIAHTASTAATLAFSADATASTMPSR